MGQSSARPHTLWGGHRGGGAERPPKLCVQCAGSPKCAGAKLTFTVCPVEGRSRRNHLRRPEEPEDADKGGKCSSRKVLSTALGAAVRGQRGTAEPPPAGPAWTVRETVVPAGPSGGEAENGGQESRGRQGPSGLRVQSEVWLNREEEGRASRALEDCSQRSPGGFVRDRVRLTPEEGKPVFVQNSEQEHSQELSLGIGPTREPPGQPSRTAGFNGSRCICVPSVPQRCPGPRR